MYYVPGMDSKWVPGMLDMLGTRYGYQVDGIVKWVPTRYLVGTRSRYAGYLLGVWLVPGATGAGMLGIWWVFGGYLVGISWFKA